MKEFEIDIHERHFSSMTVPLATLTQIAGQHSKFPQRATMYDINAPSGRLWLLFVFLNRLCLYLQAWIFLCIAVQFENLEILFIPRSFLSPCFCTFYISFLYTVIWKIRDWRKGRKIKRGCFRWKMRSCCGIVGCKIDFSCSFQW